MLPFPVTWAERTSRPALQCTVFYVPNVILMATHFTISSISTFSWWNLTHNLDVYEPKKSDASFPHRHGCTGMFERNCVMHDINICAGKAHQTSSTIWSAFFLSIRSAHGPLSCTHSLPRQYPRCPTSHSRVVLPTSLPLPLYHLWSTRNKFRSLGNDFAAEDPSTPSQPQTYCRAVRLSPD